MVAPIYNDDDFAFDNYSQTTTDPGSLLLIGTIAICVSLNALLPFLVAIGKHFDKGRRTMQNYKQSQSDTRTVTPVETQTMQRADEGNSQRSFSTNNRTHDYGLTLSQLLNRPVAPSIQSASIRSFSQRSVISMTNTMASSALNPSLTIGPTSATGIHHNKRSRTQRRFRKAMEKRELLEESGKKADSFFRFDTSSGAQAHYPIDQQRRTDNDDHSFLSKMDTDEVSVQSFTMDAEHEDFLPKLFQPDDNDFDITCSGFNAWWKPNWIKAYFDRIIALSEWDFEMRRIMRLTLPFATQALFTAVLDVLTVSIISHFVGTKEVSAYVVVKMLISLSNEFVGGFWNALSPLCSQAVGTKQNKLCGEYLQMAMILYTVFSVPFMLFWWFKIEDCVLWFGFDNETASIGQEFGRVLIFSQLVAGIAEVLHGLLDVIGLENYSTIISISEDILNFLLVLLACLFTAPELYQIGLIHFGMGVFFLTLNVWIIHYKGWFSPYLEGLTGSFSLTNYKAVWLMTQTAFTLSIGFLLTDGEWELLTLFASYLGPAEVAAWSIIGTLWEAVESFTEAIGDASEVRCAFLLGCGKPKHAQVSSYKSMLIASLGSFLVTSLVFIMGEDIATWLTSDAVLQKLIADLLPLFGIGNITMTIGSVSWTLLGAQGRYRLATTVVFACSWMVTIPLAAVASVLLKLNLEGQTAAVVIGYMASGTVNAYFLLRSDWEELSRAIIESHEDTENKNTEREPEEETDMIESAAPSNCAAGSLSSAVSVSSQDSTFSKQRIEGSPETLKTP